MRDCGIKTIEVRAQNRNLDIVMRREDTTEIRK